MGGSELDNVGACEVGLCLSTTLFSSNTSEYLQSARCIYSRETIDDMAHSVDSCQADLARLSMIPWHRGLGARLCEVTRWSPDSSSSLIVLSYSPGNLTEWRTNAV